MSPFSILTKKYKYKYILPSRTLESDTDTTGNLITVIDSATIGLSILFYRNTLGALGRFRIVTNTVNFIE